MVYDFGLMKQNMKDLVESFDHAIAVSPSAEQFSRVIFVMIDKLLSLTSKINGEKEVKLHSVIVHETDTGYAQCFEADAYSKEMGDINLHEIVFSKQIVKDFKDEQLWEKILDDEVFVNPSCV